MENHDLIEGMDAAIRILKTANRELCSGSFSIWRLVEHAENHLDKQIRELLAPPPVVDVCQITYDKAKDDMFCSCGNTSHTDGFVAIDETACQPVEPIKTEGWNGRYMCQSCGATYLMEEERTRAGNTPTCEDCGQPSDLCICGDPGCVLRVHEHAL